jgi:chemotaxis protein methyltransferase CheR
MGARDGLVDQLLEAPGARDYPFGLQEFERIRRMIYERAGIQLNESKQTMVYARLVRRLRALGVDSFREYLDRLERDASFSASENQHFVNALTTNLTAFFREEYHFPLLAQWSAARGAPLRVWCAAASTGEEPYSIAMTLTEALGEQADWRVLATDIDTQVLDHARRGIYRYEAALPCGAQRLKRFFLRGRGPNDGMVRVRPELAARIEFAQVNLLHERWPQVTAFAAQCDAVFCRNVMIYFDKPTQREIVRRIAAMLKPGGLLFVGHAENFTDCRDWLVLRGKTVYERI